MKKYLPSAMMFSVFFAVGMVLWLTKDNFFYVLNFAYIGGAIALGLALYARKYRHARRVVQFLVGSYMLVFLGLIHGENMQIEGFWYYLFLGVFEAATIHYAVAKIFGPLLFGRGWCGYACWTAMVLDLLPYQAPAAPRKQKLGRIRYLVLIASLLFVGMLFLLKVQNLERVMFWSFLVGNVLYYGVGIFLAVKLRDNRAFCKYICPISVLMKPGAYLTRSRIRVDAEKCISCGKCKRICPMNVDILDPRRSRENGTECILCLSCAEACPKDAIRF